MLNAATRYGSRGAPPRSRDAVVREHRSEAAEGFSKRYGVDKLVWLETYDDAANAISREKELKK